MNRYEEDGMDDLGGIIIAAFIFLVFICAVAYMAIVGGVYV